MNVREQEKESKKISDELFSLPSDPEWRKSLPWPPNKRRNYRVFCALLSLVLLIVVLT